MNAPGINDLLASQNATNRRSGGNRKESQCREALALLCHEHEKASALLSSFSGIL